SPALAQPAASVAESADVAIRTVVAILAGLALAYLAGHPRVQRLEEILGISHIVAAGFPFFALGAIAHLPQVNLLTDSLLRDMRPLLELGLGWIGLLAGLQFDLRAAESWPPGTSNLTAMLTLVPFAVIGGVVAAVFYELDIHQSTSTLLRDAATFGAA